LCSNWYLTKYCINTDFFRHSATAWLSPVSIRSFDAHVMQFLCC
jgi:hypothetical protein